MNILLYSIIAVPFLGAILVKLTNDSKLTALVSFCTTLITLILSSIQFYQTQFVSASSAIGVIPDLLSAAFSLLTAFTWWVVSIYLYEYMKHEQRPLVFYCCFLVTLGTVQGIFFAQHFITLLAYFELMTLASFFWVIHHRDREAVKSGYFYLYLGVAAGLFIAAGLIFLSASGHNLTVGKVVPISVDLTTLSLTVGLLIAGFGIKAGMFPLHIWLPMAHPVAPTPGSALLSGILIKCGVYGLIRTAQLVNFGYLSTIQWPGIVLSVLGAITMLLGVVVALLQSNAKRLLAYHSISQVGYIILGIGLTLYLNGNILGLSGAIYHAFNHALFKSALFLGIGVIFVRTGELNLYKLGGLWRKFPLTALLMLIAVFGITGTPGLNGYVSKTILHHALSEAAHSGSWLMTIIEYLFLIVGVGTTASFVKLYYLAFLGKPNVKLSVEKGESILFTLSLAIIAVVMLVIGFTPNLFIDRIAVPALSMIGLSGIDELHHIRFWAWPDLKGMLITLTLGIFVCRIGLKTGLFHWHPPAWLSIEIIGKRIITGLNRAILATTDYFYALGSELKHNMAQVYAKLLLLSKYLDYNNRKTSQEISFSNLNFSTSIVITVLSLIFATYLF